MSTCSWTDTISCNYNRKCKYTVCVLPVRVLELKYLQSHEQPPSLSLTVTCLLRLANLTHYKTWELKHKSRVARHSTPTQAQLGFVCRGSHLSKLRCNQSSLCGLSKEVRPLSRLSTLTGRTLRNTGLQPMRHFPVQIKILSIYLSIYQ